jgi:presenilin-like A22 family membrane protease
VAGKDSNRFSGASQFFVMGLLLILVDGLAILLSKPFSELELYAFGEPSDPLNIVYFFVMMLVGTAVILALGRLFRGRLVKWVLLGVTWSSLFSTFYSFSYFVVGDPLATWMSILGSLLFVTALMKWPRWYLIDTAALLLGTAAMALIGISIRPPFMAILLIGLAVYDVIAVYGTGHMISLAEIVINSGLPLVLIIPKVRGYNEAEKVIILKNPLQGTENRKAVYMGLGDVVFPGCLAISVYDSLGIVALPIVYSIIIGTLIGFSVLSFFVGRGRPQAGLPYLCGGAILGYFISSVFFMRLVG